MSRTNKSIRTVADLLGAYDVHSYKETNDGLIAIRKGGVWLYFGWVPDLYSAEKGEYLQFGSTEKFQK